ncbi:MAG TPA: hypothetical protein PLU30_08970 [Verrucomicrobiae bacterium]|nr:hypothetical protein [Verrucomicrobiae bacterium]
MIPRFHHIVAALTCATSLTVQPSHCSAEPASLFVVARTGDLPIILSAPHGGKQSIPGVPERTVGGAGKFVKLRDDNTDTLAFRLADAIGRRMAARPYLVVASFHRKFIDANRPPAGAYESEAAQPHYDAYHGALRDACRAVRERWGFGVLIDIHGQGIDNGAIFRGTINGKTARGLLKRFGRAAISGPDSILGQLESRGYRILPPCTDPDARETQLIGGYTISTHAAEGSGIDGIQLEFGRDFRDDKAIDRTAEDLALAIGTFAKAFLGAL